MLNTCKFIELVKNKMDCTYGEIHRQSGAGRQTVSSYKNGRAFIPLYQAEILCEWANIDPANVLPDLMAERSKTKELANSWKKISKALTTASSLVIVGSLQVMSQAQEVYNQLCILC